MVFSSIVFIFYFLPVFLVGYYVGRCRTGLLLAGSAAFYVWGEGAYILLLAALIGLNYAGARIVAAARAPGRRRAFAAGLITLDLAVLGLFKYAGFVAANLNAILPGSPLPEIALALPLGISFFTFQLISYVLDVHWKRVEVEKDAARFAAYILMFPHLIAGPIVRFAAIRDELHADRRQTRRLGLGIQYFIVGLCQKVLVANSVAPLADHAFGLPVAALDPATAWVGALSYTLQIYFDFCGYSNMAIGLAFMLGFTFPKNFDYPYAAASITEFWRRWHMSLSSWFRDYVYIPLGGNREGAAKTFRNLLVVFLLTGVWHGAAWTFVVWGLFHGGFLLLERAGLGRLLARAPRPIGHLYALLVVMAGWVLFRADTLPQAVGYLAAMTRLGQMALPPVDLLVLLNNERLAAIAAGLVFAVPTLPWLLDRLRTQRLTAAASLEPRLDTQGVHVLSTPLLLGGLLLSVAVLAGTTLNPFLYFRF
ncbi:MBOAT family protein [uncultured Phenylobacterium sp.]|uniref:MBOAT family O-acyltransferase n=1 Tax=uncultured Phenylobacterium sp. TaxID=349273 RepID=UPI0025E05698|nr:MBOAT family O-acyltransferase [uncultured Phenylobacterium sp.]